MNQFTLQNLTESSQSGSNESINYDVSIEDILEIGSAENKSPEEEPESNITEEGETKEIPPVDRMPTVFKGLLGGLSNGFGLF